MTQNLRWLLLCLFIGVGSVAWAVTGTITFGSNETKIDKSPVTGVDDLGNSWTITTVGTTSFTNNNGSNYSQVGSSNRPAKSITFTTTLKAAKNVTAFSAKFGGFNGTAGTVTLKIDDTEVGTGNLNGQNDVTVSSNQVKEGTTLTVTVTEISKGVACYNISYSYDGNGGDAPTPTNTSSFNLTTVSYQPNPTEDLIVWSNDIFTMKNEKNSSSTSVNNYIPITRNSTRFYTGNLLTITPSSSYKITKVTFIAASESYANVLANSTWTNATASASGTEVTITPTDGTSAIQATIGATCGFTKVEVEYEETTPKTSTSVTINATGINTDIANGNNLGQLLATVLANDEAISEATVDWSSSDETVATVDENGNVTASKIGTTTITATYVGNTTYASSFATYDLTVINSTPIPSTNNTFQKITSTNDLVAGCEYVIVNEGYSTAIANYNNLHFEKTNITISNNTFEANNNINVLTLGGTEGAWTFATSLEAGKYLGLTSDGNNLESLENGGTWLISFDADGNALIQPVNYTERWIMYNSNQPRFACYKGTQNKIQLFKKVESLIRVIPDVATLKAFRESVNGGADYTDVDVKLTADLDMTGETWTEPIGTAANPFRGKFIGEIYTEKYTNSDGDLTYRYKTRTISNLTGKSGLFGYVEGATIEKVALGVNIDSDDANANNRVDNTGGLVNHSTGNTKIIDCIVTGSVIGDAGAGNNVGGVVGYASGNIEVSGCDVTLAMNGMYYVGGVVGYLDNSAGSSTAKITDCSANSPSGSDSKILARTYVGGIVGYADGNVLVSKCFNKSQINATASYGTSTADRAYIGGIVGYATANVSIERSYNKGGLTMNAPGEGGIVGYTEGSVTYCYNTGSLGGHDCIGGIIGIANGATVTHSYSDSKVTGNGTSSRYLGAIVGFADTEEGGRGISHASNNYYVKPAGTGANYGCGGTSADAQGMTFAADGLLSWVLVGDDKLGDGTSSGDARRWVFVRENAPLLYDVRGQEISLKGNDGRNITDASNLKTFATFASDVAFTCENAFWAERVTRYNGSQMFVFQQTSILYPSTGENYMKGYMLKASPGTTFKLVYRPEAEMDRVVNNHVTYQPWDYVNGKPLSKVENTEENICTNNFMYGVGQKTSYDNLYKGNGTIYYLSGNVENGTTYAVFKKLIAENTSSIGDNKTYLLVGQSETGASETSSSVGAKLFNISFNEFVEPSKVLLGDVDVDGSVTISDVVKVVNAIISDVYDDDVMEYGDVNGDGELDVADVVGIVNTVLDIRYDDVKARKVSSAVNGGNEASLEQNDGLVDFLLNNSNAFCAFQFYMNAEDGLDCEKVTLSARAKGHSVSMNKLSDGRYKVMCYSGGNNTFAGNEGELFNILISGASGKLTLENLFFVTPGASKVKFGNLDIDVVPTGINSIDADVNANAAIFDLSGRRVQQPQKGVYIVNGKKIMY